MRTILENAGNVVQDLRKQKAILFATLTLAPVAFAACGGVTKSVEGKIKTPPEAQYLGPLNIYGDYGFSFSKADRGYVWELDCGDAPRSVQIEADGTTLVDCGEANFNGVKIVHLQQ